MKIANEYKSSMYTYMYGWYPSGALLLTHFIVLSSLLFFFFFDSILNVM